MPRRDYKRCRYCGRPTSEVGALSHTRQCQDCWNYRRAENIRQLLDHKGPMFQHWRRKHITAAGGILPEDLR